MQRVIHGEIWNKDFTQLNSLIQSFQSCVRFCYNRFRKEELDFNDVRTLAKIKYTSLNTRQVSDAVVQGQALQTRHKDNKIVFGGRKNWDEYKAGKITKEEWLKQRDKQLYFRGDSTKSGNPNARVVGNTLRLTVGNRKFVSFNLFIPRKFQQQLEQVLKSGIAYNVRLVRKDDNHFKVMIDHKDDTQPTTITMDDGVIGVDTNPDRIAIANVNKDGNLVETKSFINNRILYGSHNKRNYDLGCLVKQVINYAKEQNKGIVFENLKFKKDFKPYEKKWNRKKSNFAWKRFVDLLERKCIENGIEYKKANPAFTSIIGKYKYRLRYKINIHESAAYVIGRRGMGFNEKLSFYGCPKLRVKKQVVRTLAGKYDGKRIHSWKLWKTLNDYVKATLTGFQMSLHNLKELCAHICDDSVNLSSEVFLSELIVGSNGVKSIQEKERSPSKLLQVW